MTITTFNIVSGSYAFEEQGLVTAPHQHPALEIIIARDGTFQITDPDAGTTTTLSAAIIRANAFHAIDAADTICELWMFENESAVLPILLEKLNLPADDSSLITISDDLIPHLTSELLSILTIANTLPKQQDERITTIIDYLTEHIADVSLSHDQLAHRVHLSPSRFSHLFKTQIGVSVSRYILWLRLKHAIDIMLKEKITLLAAGYRAGFYDAAHFSRTFLKIFGVNPSSSYNNSIVQI